MKVAIVGGQNIYNTQLVKQAMSECAYPMEDIVTTEDPGIASCVREICEADKIKFEVMYPDWSNIHVDKDKLEIRTDKNTGKKYNHRAAVNRNRLLTETCDAVVVIWDGRSRGVKDIIDHIPSGKSVWTTIVQPSVHTFDGEEE